jgi:hypothetical protein
VLGLHPPMIAPPLLCVGEAVKADDGDGEAVKADDGDGEAVKADDGDGEAVKADDGDGDVGSANTPGSGITGPGPKNGWNGLIFGKTCGTGASSSSSSDECSVGLGVFLFGKTTGPCPQNGGHLLPVGLGLDDGDTVPCGLLLIGLTKNPLSES